MRASAIERFGDIADVAVRDVPEPEPADGELLVDVKAAAVNPADIKVLTHEDGGAFLHASKFPLVLGFDFSGVVANTAGKYKPGDEVFGFLPYRRSTRGGTFAERVTAAADGVGPKPRHLSHEQAAAAATTAMSALQCLRDRFPAGGAVLINGASGGVGSYAVEIAKNLGAGLIVGTASAAKAEYVRSRGAHRVVDYKTTPIREIGAQFDVVVDAAATSSFGACASILKPKGTYITTLPSGALVAGMLRAAFSSKKCKLLLVKNAAADFEQLARWFDEGKLSPVLDRAYPLAEVPAALQRLRDGDVRGKLAITI
jgi:NADPH:quinone reductase-like Zn-dependent oxidoreductase